MSCEIHLDCVRSIGFCTRLDSIAYRAFFHRVVSEFRRRSNGSEIGSVAL